VKSTLLPYAVIGAYAFLMNGGPQLSSLVVHNGQLKSAEELEVHYKPVKQSLVGQMLKHKVFYIMLFPCIAFFLIFSYWPMAGLVLAFRDYGFDTGIFGGEFVGLKYFEQFFTDARSWIYIKNTLIISFNLNKKRKNLAIGKIKLSVYLTLQEFVTSFIITS